MPSSLPRICRTAPGRCLRIWPSSSRDGPTCLRPCGRASWRWSRPVQAGARTRRTTSRAEQGRAWVPSRVARKTPGPAGTERASFRTLDGPACPIRVSTRPSQPPRLLRPVPPKLPTQSRKASAKPVEPGSIWPAGVGPGQVALQGPVPSRMRSIAVELTRVMITTGKVSQSRLVSPRVQHPVRSRGARVRLAHFMSQIQDRRGLRSHPQQGQHPRLRHRRDGSRSTGTPFGTASGITASGEPTDGSGSR
jgi:hypothetical protein